MTITIEACKADTYVGCPPPATTPPECGDAGWEIGNGTITCATVTVTREPLPATGVDPGAIVASSLLAAVLIGSGIVMLARRKGRDS